MENLVPEGSLLILFDTLSFAAKGFIVFLTVLACTIVVVALSRRGKSSAAKLEVKRLNDRYRKLGDTLRRKAMEPKAYKKLLKTRAKEQKLETKKRESRRRVWVLDFEGDMAASGVDSLREEISGIVAAAGKDDEVFIRIETPGGVVHGYGLAASQLLRLKRHGIRLVAAVDKVAASGGYMMACVADRIIAAPFAILGSIGVAAPVPNLHRLLEKNGVDYLEITGGEYKRTVSMFGEVTESGKAKFQEQVDEAHGLFKSWVKEHRAELDIDTVATGEYWYGQRALELGLADDLQTSDDYLLAATENSDLFGVTYQQPKSLKDRLATAASLTVERTLVQLWTRLANLRV